MKMMIARRILVAIIVLLAIGQQAYATHLRAGEIIVERLCDALTFRITVRVFTNLKNTNVKFGGDPDVSYIYFGDGNRPENREFVPEIPTSGSPKGTYIIRYDLDPDGSIAEATYTTTHTYGGYQRYIVSYQEPNRNEGVVNMDGSINTLFYIETVINIDPLLDAQGGCNNLPRLTVPPIDKACVGAAWSHNAGAYDPDGIDSISYELVVPFSASNRTVINYRDPNDPRFYTDFGHGNEDQSGEPLWKIDPFDGTLTWDSPGSPGEYNIAFIIKEWRLIRGVWYMMGFIRRDMQIIVEDCANERPRLQVPEDICVEAGTKIFVPIIGTDPDNDNVLIQGYSEIFQLAPSLSPAVMSYPPPDTLMPKYQSSVPQAVANFNWQTECFHIQQQPYQVVFKITDNPPPGKGAKLVTFETWRITVVGPAPQWGTAVLNPGPRTVQLDWDDYTCTSAQTMQVWRRVDSFDFDPAECETGMPDYAGYTQIGEVPIGTSAFLDKSLTPGAKYCYRLVATFLKGGESYVSDEICVDPILIDGPVITNVSVQKTGEADGEMFVKWTEPFDIDQVQFPGPYEYEVYRAEGFAGNQGLTKVSGTTRITATSIVDPGINTMEKPYNYRIVLYSNTQATPTVWEPVDTSAVASSVRLEAKSLLNKIQLNWTAIVPWSNQSPTYPTHDLFRGPEGSTDPGDFDLIAEVTVTSSGLMYVDEDNLQQNLTYCYYVKARGAYGNPLLDPLENLSQIICAQPGDENPPCQPVAPIADQPLSCEEYVEEGSTCNNNIFSNTIKWNRPDDTACRNDVSYYKIYVSNATSGTFVLYATNVRDTFFVDDDLVSFARCYKISAVDRSDNESELSDAICFDNCPYYELPNIFTPNNDGCNDFFSAYSDRDPTGGENGEGNDGCVTPDINKAKCARFVEKVDIKIINRWGKQVYSYTSGGENTIYIDWDGISEDGTELSSGIYYYVAEVTFDSVDPGSRHKTLKGWVHSHAVDDTSGSYCSFDGVCNLCNSSIQFIIRRDASASFRFAALQSAAGQELLKKFSLDQQELYSVVLIDNGRPYTRSDAALRIARHLDGVWPLLYAFRIVPRFLRDIVYNLIAKNRYRMFGKKDQCMIPTPELKSRFIA